MTAAELKQYERWKDEVQLLRGQNQHLRLELDSCRPALYNATNADNSSSRRGQSTKCQ